MSVTVTLTCDRENRYGVCAATSLPAQTLVDAVRIAEAAGWLYRPGRDGAPDQALCPLHAGARRGARA